MTGVAGKPSGVIRRGNLRKVLRFGGVGLVTARTHHGCVQLLGLHRTGIVRVLGQGPVASLASDNHMLAKLFLIHDVGMTGLARAVPGKRNRSRGDLADRRAAIMAILTKTARHDRGAQDHERDQRYYHDDNEPEEVFGVLK